MGEQIRTGTGKSNQIGIGNLDVFFEYNGSI